MRHPVAEEGILLSHDLGRHLQNGAGALVEGADQPVRGLQAVVHEGLAVAVGGEGGNLGIVNAVDQDARQGVAVELDSPAPAGPGRHRSEEHTSELQSLMRISYAVFCLKTKNQAINTK